MSTITKVNVGGVDYDLGGGGGGTLVETTYAQLKELVDVSGLTPGNRYRITDFVSMFAFVQSANHPFDLIVTANTENTFYPKAQAILHEGDDYFAKCDLSKWEIWYDFSNNTKEHPLADSEGKGYIYRMIDEWNNDVNYDFKNLLVKVEASFFPFFASSADDETHFYTFSYATDSTKESLLAVSDYSVKNGQYCKNNYIKAKYGTSSPFNNGVGIFLGICGGVSGMVINGIKNNHIEGDTFAVFSYTMFGGSILENVSYNCFSVSLLAGDVFYNSLFNGKLKIGPGFYDWINGVKMGSITNNTILSTKRSSMNVSGQDVDSLSFSGNIIKSSGIMKQKANIVDCEISGTFTLNDSNEYPTITEAQEGKLIVGKGDTLAIIDPATFYTP